MTQNPITIPQGARVADAVEIMRLRKISELPVVDGEGRPVGLIDVTDILSLFPAEEVLAEAQVA
jgi:arabinose-5-phosphate isomerase